MDHISKKKGLEFRVSELDADSAHNSSIEQLKVMNRCFLFQSDDQETLGTMLVCTNFWPYCQTKEYQVFGPKISFHRSKNWVIFKIFSGHSRLIIQK
jgi:MarR-like DNA-binding transcriptional regulator SgrR of sgrS sRNA